MYDELVAMLRRCATEAAACKTCNMAEDGSCTDTLMKQAADAIEELSKRVQELEYDPTCGPEWRDCHDLGD